MRDKRADIIVDNFVKLVKDIRLEKGLSHQKLADKTGLSRAAISYFESRKRQPTLTTVIRICLALEIPFSDIIKNIEKEIL